MYIYIFIYIYFVAKEPCFCRALSSVDMVHNSQASEFLYELDNVAKIFLLDHYSNEVKSLVFFAKEPCFCRALLPLDLDLKSPALEFVIESCNNDVKVFSLDHHFDKVSTCFTNSPRVCHELTDHHFE